MLSQAQLAPAGDGLITLSTEVVVSIIPGSLSIRWQGRAGAAIAFMVLTFISEFEHVICQSINNLIIFSRLLVFQ